MFKARRVLLFALLSLALPAAFAAPAPPPRLTSALRWRSVGPYTGGRATAVAGIAAEPNVFYQGTAGGGVWESEDYGHNWKNISDKDFKSNNIGAMAIAPSNPKIIYVGTGDSAPRNTVLTGEGMYKSTDGGKTWTFIGLGETHIINWILVDPTNPDVVYVASLGHLFVPNSERGVFKTTDGGRTWQKILYVNDETGAIDMAMDPPIRAWCTPQCGRCRGHTGDFPAEGQAAASTRRRMEARTGPTFRIAMGFRPASSEGWASRWRRAVPTLCTH